MIKKKLGIDPNASELDEEVLKKIEAEIERLDENYGMNSEPGDDENTNSEDKGENNQETKEQEKNNGIGRVETVPGTA